MGSSGTGCLRLAGSATVTAVQHAVPVFGPAFAPTHGPATNGARFLRQILFVPLKTRGFGHVRLQSKRAGV